MMGATRTELERGGVRATRAEFGGLEIQLLRFPALHGHGPFEFEEGYVVVVLDGALAKSFSRATWSLSRGSVASLPVGAMHASQFGPTETRVVTVRNAGGERVSELAPLVRRARHVRAATICSLGWRLATELRAPDASWGVAAEGVALQLLATMSRTTRRDRRPARRKWLREVRDLIHDAAPRSPGSLSELADAVGVHSTHLARAFRREYGMTIGEYSRSLRLEWAAGELVLADASLADVAARAGFADQSHFTRAFRRHYGLTPGRYRLLLRS
jgi:AraC family transcriptional regulator